MLQTLRFLATAAALVPLAVFFRDSIGRGRNYVAARHGARLALFAGEAAALAGWALVVFALRRDAAPFRGTAAPVAAVAGALLAPAGTAFAAWGRLRLGRLFTATFGVQQGHTLVTDGPYAVTRHPVYTGILAFFLGLALLWNSAATLVLVAVVAALLWTHTVVEERLFAAHFGPAFDDYRRRVPRLVPWPWRSRRTG